MLVTLSLVLVLDGVSGQDTLNTILRSHGEESSPLVEFPHHFVSTTPKSCTILQRYTIYISSQNGQAFWNI